MNILGLIAIAKLTRAEIIEGNIDRPSPSKLFKHNVPHVRQRFNWDCGITCVLMLLTDRDRNEVLENFSRICLEEGFRQSTWTIDLCYLLKRYNIHHCMYTSRQAASTSVLHKEEADRVDRRFKNASSNGITVKVSALTTQQLATHVVTTGPAIVLVDATLLSCDWCKHNTLSSEFRRIFGGGYRGHFITIVGCLAGKLLYRNPGLSKPLCATSLKRLNNARMVPGTDYDIILIYKHY